MRIVLAIVLFLGLVAQAAAQAHFAARTVAARNASFLQGMGFGVPSLAGQQFLPPTAIGPSGLTTRMGTTVGSTIGTQTGSYIVAPTGQ
ncbi:MAG TPA: hypothetical protein VE999_05950 [Gemmataceae bacterium]|nr:hypothetical protein [Gemmataceae bacterium]